MSVTNLFKTTCMKVLTLILFFGLLCTIAKSQDSTNAKFNQSFFLGLGGPGFGGSFNYQQRIIKSNLSNGLFVRAGVGALGPIPGKDGGALFISLPIGLHYNFTKSAKLEIGGGITPYTFTNSQPAVAGFASLAFYPLRDHTIRLVFSPFFHNPAIIKNYFGASSSVLLWGGVDVLFPLKKQSKKTQITER
jgi:hypothetical protein